MASSPLLSVCMIVKNEAAMLPDCLRSVADIADEIVIVDTGSDDATRTIAREFGCILREVPWKNDFAAARNASIEAARGAWILSIDADERLQDGNELRSALSTAPPQVGGFMLELVSEAVRSDGSRDTFVNYLLRVFRKSPAIRFHGAIHEQVFDAVAAAGYQVESCSARLIHLGYGLSSSSMAAKLQRNLNILNEVLARNPNDGYLLMQRGKTLFGMGRAADAAIDFEHALGLDDSSESVRMQALNFAATIRFQAGDHAQAVELAQDSLVVCHAQVFAHYILGECFTELGRHSDGLRHYRSMEEARRRPDLVAALAGDYRLPHEQVRFRLGRSLTALGRYNEAGREFQDGLAANPDDIGCRVGIADLALKNGDHATARQLLNEAIRLAPERQELRDYLAQVERSYSPNSQNNSQQGTDMDPAKYQKPAPSDTSPARTASFKAAPPAEPIDHDRRQGFDLPTLTKIGQSPSAGTRGKRPLLSLCMIVKNEEHYLPDCLTSVQDIVDEIVINDTGSRDRTIAIAREAGARIIQTEWKDDFAAARNAALQQCRGEWIAYLDADERLEPAQAAYIKSLLRNAPDTIGAYVCAIVSPHRQLDGSRKTHTGGYPRVFRNYGYPQIEFRGRVHEQISPSILDLGKGIDRSDIRIHHLGYDSSHDTMQQKIKRNYRLLLQHVKEEPENPYAWFQLGQTLALMSLRDQAEQALAFAMQLGSLPQHLAASCAASLAQIAGSKRDFASALRWADFSLEQAPVQVCAMNLRAYALFHLQRHNEAVQAFREALLRLDNRQGIPQTAFDVEIPRSTIEEGLAESLRKIAEAQG